MKSMNDNSIKTSLFEQDVNLTRFRKRNKILILIFLLLIISVTVILGVLITHLVHNTSWSYKPPVNPAVRAFCYVTDDNPSCLKAFNPIISTRSRTDPNQIFTLSLQTASKRLENALPLLLSASVGHDSNKTVMVAFKNCSDSLPVALGRIQDVLAKMRVNPFVETRNDEHRVEMMNKIMAAEGDLNSCIENMRRVGSTDAGKVRAEVHEVKVYVSSSGDFLLGYAKAKHMFYGDYSIVAARGTHAMFYICLGGLELLFMLFLFCSLFGIR